MFSAFKSNLAELKSFLYFHDLLNWSIVLYNLSLNGREISDLQNRLSDPFLKDHCFFKAFNWNSHSLVRLTGHMIIHLPPSFRTGTAPSKPLYQLLPLPRTLFLAPISTRLGPTCPLGLSLSVSSSKKSYLGPQFKVIIKTNIYKLFFFYMTGIFWHFTCKTHTISQKTNEIDFIIIIPILQ